MSSEPVNLFTMTKDLMIDVWGLERDREAKPKSLSVYKFPIDSSFVSKVVFDGDMIRIEAYAWRDHFVKITDTQAEASFLSGDKIHASNELFFDWVLSAVAQLMLVATMGYDTPNRLGEYTQNRIKEIVKKRGLKCAKTAVKMKS